MIGFTITLFEWIWQAFTPATFGAIALAMLTWSIDFAIALLPAGAETALEAFKTFLASPFVASIFKVAVYLLSFAFQPNVMLMCFAALTIAWPVFYVVRLVLWIKGHIWAGSN